MPHSRLIVRCSFPLVVAAVLALAACADRDVGRDADGTQVVKYVYDRNSDADLAKVTEDAEDFCDGQGRYTTAELVRIATLNDNEAEAVFRCL